MEPVYVGNPGGLKRPPLHSSAGPTWDSKDPLMAAYRREVDIVAVATKDFEPAW